MELRVLNYFLTVAREENITRAAQLLHITQPTLSRQLMQLEEELGVQLFHRGKHSISLTNDGMLFRRRAQEIVSLSEKTKSELQRKEEIPSGEIAIGCGETKSMSILSACMVSFRKSYPLVQFSVYSANADDIKERIEKGLLDMGLLMEPVAVDKYEFIRLPQKERWGVLVRADSFLAQKDTVSPQDLQKVSLLIPRRESVRNELANWFGDSYGQIEIVATFDLSVNAANMVANGLGIAVCIDLGIVFEQLRFIPFAPQLESGSILAWKKEQTLSTTNMLFFQHIRNSF